MLKKLTLTLALLALAGCAGSMPMPPMPPMPPSDAMPVTSHMGAPVTSGSNVPETGRNWNCKMCYK